MSANHSMKQRFRSGILFESLTTKIRAKLLLTLVGVALLPLMLFGIVMYRSASQELREQNHRYVETVRAIKANQVEENVSTLFKQIKTFSENGMIVDAMQSFSESMPNARAESKISQDRLAKMSTALEDYYQNEFAKEYKQQTGLLPPIEGQLAEIDDDSRYLQYRFIAENPNPLNEKAILDSVADDSEYSRLHESLHPIIRNYRQQFGIEDIFLCDLESGDIVYSVFKGLEFTTSLIDGPYADSHLGRVFKQAAASENKGDATLVDFELYLPRYERMAGFVASPIFAGDRKVGVAVFHLSADRFNQVLAEPSGLDTACYTHLIGPDRRFRSTSRASDRNSVASLANKNANSIETWAAESALSGESGTALLLNDRGNQVLSSWSPITIYEGSSGVSEPIHWALVSQFDDSDVAAPLVTSKLAKKALMISALGLLLGLWFASYFAKGITRQAESINDMLAQIGIGDFDARAQVVTKDELGDVAVALNAMCDNTLALIQSREERDQIEHSILDLVRELEDIAAGDLTITAEVREDLTGPIADSVNFMIAQLRSIVQTVKSATQQLNESASEVREISGELSDDSIQQADRIATTSNQIREITESIQSVAAMTRESANVASKARDSASKGLMAVSNTVDGMQRIRDQVQETSKRIKRLGESSQEIGEIVQLIADIADRTSILALNASIQAAMAGDSGQGFAVVAEEVERLAERSNDATKQIATLIKAIQTETGDAITDMEESTREVVAGSQLASEAGSTLEEIDRVSSQLADLIAEVSSATDTQSGAARNIASTMGEISETTNLAANRSRTAARRVGALAELATDLSDSVSQFRVSVDVESGVELSSDRADEQTVALVEDLAVAAAVASKSTAAIDDHATGTMPAAASQPV